MASIENWTFGELALAGQLPGNICSHVAHFGHHWLHIYFFMTFHDIFKRKTVLMMSLCNGISNLYKQFGEKKWCVVDFNMSNINQILACPVVLTSYKQDAS